MRVNEKLGPMPFVVEVFLLFSKVFCEKTYCSVLLYRRSLCCFLENQVLNKGKLLRVKSSRPQDIFSHFPVEFQLDNFSNQIRMKQFHFYLMK